MVSRLIKAGNFLVQPEAHQYQAANHDQRKANFFADS